MDKLNVLVSLITEDNDFQLEQAASAQTAAMKVGASVQIIYANNDAVLQTQQILEFIQDPCKRPDAILVEPVGTGMLQVAKAAVAAGIGWVVINAGVSDAVAPACPRTRVLGLVGPRADRKDPGITDCRHPGARRNGSLH